MLYHHTLERNMSMSDKKIYSKFCEENDVPVFFQPFWLDITCKANNWDYIYIKKGKEKQAIMPYYKKRKGFIGMPPLTPYMGPIINFPDDIKYSNRLSQEHSIYKEIISKLPNFQYFNQRFHPEITNWLPFYWSGYNQTTKYTYILPAIDNLTNVYSNFKNNVKRNIKKAGKQYWIRELKENEIENFYNIIKKNLKPTFSYTILKELRNVCKKRDCGKILGAFDNNGTLYASIFFVWDKKMAYYILGAKNPDVNINQAMSLLLWSAIQHASEKNTKMFDFEGSMIEPIERYFRTFGALQKKYMQVYKVRNRFLKLALCFTNAVNIKL